MTNPCVGKHPDTEHPPGDPIWCAQHTWAIRDALTALPDAVTHLTERRDGRLNPTGTTEKGGKNTSGKSAPSPSPGWDEVDEILLWGRAWCDSVARELGDTHHVVRITTAGNPYRANLTEQVAYLLRNLERWTALPGISEDLGREITATHRKAVNKSGRGNLTHRLPGECTNCGTAALRRDNGEETVYCAHCGKAWTWDDHATWVREAVADPRRKTHVNAAELAHIINTDTPRQGVTVGLIRVWANRGLIDRVGRNQRGHTLYDHAAVVAWLTNGEDQQAG